MNDLISRQAAISAICNACGKIDCDKMDKCEKLQLPPANSSEFPNNSDTISRQAAIEVIDAVFPVNPMKSEYAQGIACGAALAKTYVEQLPSAQTERPKGEWIDNETSYADGVRQTCTCSVCGIRSVRPLGDFCRWCGADMRGQQDE